MSVREELRRVDVVQRRSSCRLQRQQTADQLAGGQRHVRRNRELVAHDAHVRLLQSGRLERRTTAQQRVPVQYSITRTRIIIIRG